VIHLKVRPDRYLICQVTLQIENRPGLRYLAKDKKMAAEEARSPEGIMAHVFWVGFRVTHDLARGLMAT
jgi:hypothetical protein